MSTTRYSSFCMIYYLLVILNIEKIIRGNYLAPSTYICYEDYCPLVLN